MTENIGASYFLWSCLLGLILGFCYDILRYVRKVAKPSVLLVNIEDFLFLLVLGGLLFLTAFLKNDGRLRLSGFLGTGTGLCGYYLMVRNRVVSFFVYFHEKTVRALLFLAKILMYPVLLLSRLLQKPMRMISWYCGKMIKAKEIRKNRRKKESTKAGVSS